MLNKQVKTVNPFVEPPDIEVGMDKFKASSEASPSKNSTNATDAIIPSEQKEEPIWVPERTSPLGLENYIEGHALVSGDHAAWTDMYVQIYSRPSKQEPFLVPSVAEPLIVWVISGEAIVEERDVGGVWVANSVAAGDFFVTQSLTPYEMRWRVVGPDPFHVMHLYISVPLYERVAYEMLGSRPPPILRDISGGRDKQLSHLLASIHEELTKEGRASPLFVRGLAQSLSVHLIRNYATAVTHEERTRALPAFKLQRAFAYFDEHLAKTFSLAKLAETVGMSAFHFSRVFKSATGLSPSRYLIRQRISKARQLLQETDLTIIEIGMTIGYSSPSHFAQVFRRETGMAPSRYRRGGFS